jgi:hypothetical protein
LSYNKSRCSSGPYLDSFSLPPSDKRENQRPNNYRNYSSYTDSSSLPLSQVGVSNLLILPRNLSCHHNLAIPIDPFSVDQRSVIKNLKVFIFIIRWLSWFWLWFDNSAVILLLLNNNL